MNNERAKSSDVINESESYLLLNKPEAHALKSGHCMKEDCSICKALTNVGESQSSVVLPIPVKDDSNVSLGICRICHCNPETLPELGPLLSVCNCRGTVALVHMTCLERWLAESDSSSCELCRFQFTVERIPKHGPFESVFVWINEVADFNQLLMDTIWFWLMTPLAAMAGYIFVRATSELMDDNFPTDAPWLMAALMLNSCLTLVAYYGWVMNSVKKHVSSWYRWWRTVDCIVKIQIPERQISSTVPEADERESTEGITVHNPKYEKNINMMLAGHSSEPNEFLSNRAPSLVKLVKAETSQTKLLKRKSVVRPSSGRKTSPRGQEVKI
ncbi:hypothetical protein RUM43_007413 [Polyplax serrata]|uniref:RING-CH-type domain-containing protein n=1 Tax=Polyplax serrata TaxID=468196 RepID=A0AAN8PM81_POLSC